MMFSRKLRRGHSSNIRNRKNSSRTSKSAFRPRMEGLEDRQMLTAMGVTNLDDSGPGSLRQAIIDANNQEGADVITFADGVEGTINLTGGQLAITDELTVDGPGSDVLTVSGGGTSRVFHVSGATVAIDDLTIADGMASDLIPENPDLGWFASGGGLLNLGGNVTVSDVHLVGNTAQGWLGSGGGIGNFFGGQLTVNQSTLEGNSAFGLGYSFGGAIDSTGGTTLTINDSQFSGNTLNVGGGLDPNVDFSGMVGGAAILTSDGAVTVNNSQFENNTAKAGDGLEGTGQSGGVAIGGAIAVFNGSFLGGYSQSDLHIAGSTFSENQAIGGAGADGSDGVRGGDGGPAYGGAINVSNGAAATIVQSEFVGNQAVSADGGHGGAGADGGHSGVYGPLFFSSAGGAISQVGSSLVVVDSSFSGNIVQGGNGGQGGAGGNGGNGSTNRGGALTFAPWGGAELNKVSLTNATITNNTAMAGNGGNAGDGGTNGSNGDASGAGFFSYSVSGRNDLMFIEITDSAITGNDAQAPAGSEISGSGVHASFGANLTLENVDISDNKEVLGGAETVVDGYTCEGIATAEGNCVAPQQGDANRDGKVDMEDFLALSAAFGQEGDWLNGDFDLDGEVSFADFLLLAANFGESNG